MLTPYRYIPILSETYRSLRRIFATYWYAGSAVVCPVCERTFSKWKKNDQSCPYCHSGTRHKALILYLKSYLGKCRGQIETLLFAPDFGVEGWLRKHSQIKLTTADYSAPKVDHHWDITDIPVDNDSFDLILCSHVMEHVVNDARAYVELHRTLRTGGLLVLQVPYQRNAPHTDEDFSITDPKEREARFGQFDHVRIYGKDLLDRLEAAGFECDVRTAQELFGPEAIKNYGMWNDVIFLCKSDVSVHRLD